MGRSMRCTSRLNSVRPSRKCSPRSSAGIRSWAPGSSSKKNRQTPALQIIVGSRKCLRLKAAVISHQDGLVDSGLAVGASNAIYKLVRRIDNDLTSTIQLDCCSSSIGSSLESCLVNKCRDVLLKVSRRLPHRRQRPSPFWCSI